MEKDASGTGSSGEWRVEAPALKEKHRGLREYPDHRGKKDAFMVGDIPNPALYTL